MHRDAEYGHQYGEVNFWVAFVDTDDKTSLWVESQPGNGDFRPFPVKVGEALRFWAVHKRHFSKVNETGCTRVSMDFRVSVKCSFDSEWKLPQMDYVHKMLSCNLVN